MTKQQICFCLMAWPGNVRELENVLQRAIVLSSGGKIMAGDIMVDGALQDRFAANMTLKVHSQKCGQYKESKRNYESDCFKTGPISSLRAQLGASRSGAHLKLSYPVR